MSEAHTSKVARLSAQMKVFYESGTKVKIFHGSTNSTRAQRFDPSKTINTSDLNSILEINTTENYAVVEPNVSMDVLVHATLKKGLITRP